jgi:predicted O-methyltransferase YrrM
MAHDLIAQLGPLRVTHLLDIGGASGTWTLAFLRAYPNATATLFDLPDAIEQARCRIAPTGLADRIRLVPGDFYVDDLPGGADLAWLSAIVHQHDRSHNRALLRKIFAALRSDGWVAIRDVVMQPCRTKPVAGALFAINMLANPDSGGTFTFDELSEDLRAAGFVAPELRLQGDMMDSVVVARRPEEGTAR